MTHAVLFLSFTNRALSRAAKAVSSSSKPSSFRRTRSPAAVTDRITPRVRSTLDAPAFGRANPISSSSTANGFSLPLRRAGGRPDALGAGPAPDARRSNRAFVRESTGRAFLFSFSSPKFCSAPSAPSSVPSFRRAGPGLSASSPSMVLLQTGAGVLFWLLCAGHITVKRSALKRHPAACAHLRW